jgi:hypothetical protein
MRFFFQRHLAPPDNRPSMSDLADDVAHAFSAALMPGILFFFLFFFMLRVPSLPP